MKSRIPVILFALTAVLLFASMIQQATGVFRFKELNGVTSVTPKPEVSFSGFCDRSLQDATEAYLTQHYGFREPLTRLHNQTRWTLFRYSQAVEDQRIMITPDNWIFEPSTVEEYYQSYAYQNAEDADEMERALEAEAQRLLEIQRLLEPYGTHLFVALLPGKELVCSEHMPKNTRYFKEKVITAYDFYRKRFKELGVNHIDLGEWFVQIKDTVSYPLFPQTGTHWSNLAAIHAADTLVRYMEWLSDSNMVNIKADGPVFQRTLKPDADLEGLMNLIWSLRKTPNLLTTAQYEPDTTAWKPRLLTIGDSFYWNILNFTPVGDVFESTPYWYYFSTAYYDSPDGSDTRVGDKDVLQEVIDADFVMLAYSTVSLYSMSNGFSKSLVKKLKRKMKNEKLINDSLDCRASLAMTQSDN